MVNSKEMKGGGATMGGGWGKPSFRLRGKASLLCHDAMSAMTSKTRKNQPDEHLGTRPSRQGKQLV